MLYIGYSFVLLVCLGIALVVFGKIQSKYYPFLLYGIGAGMVLMTTLAGPYLIGSDIHLEYYYAQLRAGKEVLEPMWGTPQGTSIVTYITDNMWVWKVVYPLLFALVPVILYQVFRRFTTPTRAFLASFFFIVFPAFSMELPGIARQMVAEVFLALMLYLTFVNKWKYRWVLVGICGILLPLLHYAVAAVALVFLAPVLMLKKDSRKVASIGILSIIAVSSAYFPFAEQGAVGKKLVYLYNAWAPSSVEISAPPISIPQFPRPELVESPPMDIPPNSWEGRYEGLLLDGLGLNFFRTPLEGKIFRAIQWVLMGVMIAGVWKLRKNREYITFALGGAVIVGLQALPGFSNLLNITRFLHLALFLLAPIVATSLRPKLLVPILIVYFLFTSGAVFEATKQPNIEEVTIPYSIGLSNHRMDLGASFTEDDIEVRRYIVNNKLLPIYSDIYGSDFVGETVGWRDDLHATLKRYPIKVHGVFVFVRSRNVEDGTFTAWNGIGRRRYVDPLEHYGIDWNKNIIYQKGDARVIWVD